MCKNVYRFLISTLWSRERKNTTLWKCTVVIPDNTLRFTLTWIKLQEDQWQQTDLKDRRTQWLAGGCVFAGEIYASTQLIMHMVFGFRLAPHLNPFGFKNEIVLYCDKIEVLLVSDKPYKQLYREKNRLQLFPCLALCCAHILLSET